MEIAKKMRLDLPESIMKEIKSSEQLSKNIKKELDSRESDLDRLKLLYGIAQTQNVITEEFHNLKKIIEHGEAWINNVKNISDKVVEFKELELLNNEIKVLPFEIDEKLSSDLNERYTKAQEWLGKYNSLPKITKNQNFNVALIFISFFSSFAFDDSGISSGRLSFSIYIKSSWV